MAFVLLPKRIDRLAVVAEHRSRQNDGVSVERQAPKWVSARMLGAAMVGLENAIFGEKEERPGVVVDAPGEPPDDLPFGILLEPSTPSAASWSSPPTESGVSSS